MRQYKHSELTRQIIGAAIEIHRHLGPGLLESTYESCLLYELEKLGLVVERQKALPVVYKELKLAKAYRIDLLVDGRVVVELKAVDVVLPVHEAQVLSYRNYQASLEFHHKDTKLRRKNKRNFVSLCLCG